MNLEELKEGLAEDGYEPINITIEEWLFLNGFDDNRELVVEWLKALRSGDYKQGRGSLCNKNKYCCLGVLCEIAKIPKSVVSSKVLKADIFEYEGETGYLPHTLVIKLGISKFGSIGNTSYSLAALNDEFGSTFELIADVIESYPHLLFNN